MKKLITMCAAAVATLCFTAGAAETVLFEGEQDLKNWDDSGILHLEKVNFSNVADGNQLKFEGGDGCQVQLAVKTYDWTWTQVTDWDNTPCTITIEAGNCKDTGLSMAEMLKHDGLYIKG